MSYHNGSEALLSSQETSATEGDDRHVERKQRLASLWFIVDVPLRLQS